MENKAKRINLIIFISFAALFLTVLGKAFFVQVLDKEYLIGKAKKQFFRERKIYPKRGSIYDRNGSPLAINVQTYSLFTIPKNLKGDHSSYKKLSKIVPSIGWNRIKRKVKNRKRFTWLARKIELTKEQVVEIKKLKGVYLEAVPKRLYPNHELAAQTLGFVGIDNGGLSGIEYAFDKELRGEPKIIKYIIDNKGRPVRHESEQVGGTSKDIYLTIDKDLQSIAEKTLKDAVDKFEANSGGVGVMDVKTGEILAMANYPTFDPNEVKKSKAIHRKLSFISDPFEPGSTFKVFTVASALENNIARPDTNYYCEHGRLKVEDHIISEAGHGKDFEWLSVEDIIKYSSNVGTTKIAFDLTFPKLKMTLEKLKIGEKSGIELPGESRGIFTSDENVSPLSLSNISFGQGIATTGIQMLGAYSAIVNNGIYHKPTIIKGANKDSKGTRVLDIKTSRELNEMMVKAVEDGTGEKAKIRYFKIGGKTSTAQRANGLGGYNGYVSGFIGFPLNTEDRFVIYAYVDKPGEGQPYYGNAVAAPIFKKIAQHILYKSKTFNSLAVKEKEGDDSSIDFVNVKQSATRNMGAGTVPNFIGLDKRSVSNLASKKKLSVSHRGIGVVTSQSPEPGVKVEEDTIVNLIYSPPRYE